jgi:uncharacterized membrane protein
MKKIFKNLLKVVAFIMGLWIFFAGFGSIFLWESRLGKSYGHSIGMMILGAFLISIFMRRGKKRDEQNYNDKDHKSSD